MSTPLQAPSSVANELKAVESQFQREAAIVSARPLLGRVLLGIWIALDVLLVAFSVVTIVGYLVNGSFVEVRSIATIAANDAIHVASQRSAADDLVVGSARVIQASEGVFDAYVVVENSNRDWYATFDYAFTFGGEETRAVKGFILPGEEKYLFALNEKREGRSTSADVVLTNVVWQRVDRHLAPDVDAWLEAHAAFRVEDASYTTDVQLENDRLARSTFAVTNASPYSYWDPKFTVLLKRNGSIVGIHQATVSRFTQGETREVAVHWSGDVPVSAEAELIPNINYFDLDAYMSPEGRQGIDVRDLFTEE